MYKCMGLIYRGSTANTKSSFTLFGCLYSKSLDVQYELQLDQDMTYGIFM